MSFLLFNHKNFSAAIDKHDKILYYYVMDILNYIKNLKINSCGITECDENWSWDTGENGFHDFDLWTVIRGKGRIICGQEYVEVGTGSSLLLFPETHYRGEQDKGQHLTVINVHFFFYPTLPQEMLFGKEKFLCRVISDITYFRDILYRVIRLYNADNPTLSETVFSTALIEYLLQDDPDVGIKKFGNGKTEIIKNICDLVNTSTANVPSLSEMAKKYGYSSDYLSRLFSATIGISFSEYVANARINKAKFLLSSSDMTVEEVSDALGYYDSCYFIRQFKKITGISPGKYKKEKIK